MSGFLKKIVRNFRHARAKVRKADHSVLHPPIVPTQIEGDPQLLRHKNVKMKKLLNKTKRQIHWLPSISCNYDCAYCFNPTELKKRDSSRLTDVDRIARAFLSIPDVCTVVLCGGEPFHQRNLLKVCRRISEKHHLEFVTNLSYDITWFCDNIPAERVVNLSVSLHIDERERLNGIDKLLINLKILKEKGYHFQVSQVLYPTVLNRFEALSDMMANHGVTLFPKTFEGQYNGKYYPGAYTEAEKIKILEYIDRTNTTYEDVRHAKEILLQAPEEKKLFSFRGQLCTSGFDDIIVMQDGSVLRCWTNSDDEALPNAYHTNHLGNLFDGTFKWNGKIEPCSYNVCYCPLMGFECVKRAQEYDA